MKASEQIYSNLKDMFLGNVYPLVNPESEEDITYPYLVYTVINTNPEVSIDGYLGYEMTYIQLDIYSKNYDTTEEITKSVIDTLDQNIKPFHYEGRNYFYESEDQLFRQSIECHIWHKN